MAGKYYLNHDKLEIDPSKAKTKTWADKHFEKQDRAALAAGSRSPVKKKVLNKKPNYDDEAKPDFEDWRKDTPRYRKHLADIIANDMTNIRYEPVTGGFKDKWGEPKTAAEAVAEQQKIQDQYESIYPPQMQQQYEREKMNKNKKKTTTFNMNNADKKYPDDHYLSKQSIRNDVRKKEFQNRKAKNPPYLNFSTSEMVVAEDTKERAAKALGVLKADEKKRKDDLIDYTFRIDSDYFAPPHKPAPEIDKLEEMLLGSAMRKIDETMSGIGKVAPKKLAEMNSGGPVDDGPPTLDQYLRLGLTLATLTPDERKVVQDLLKQTLFRTKDEK